MSTVIFDGVGEMPELNRITAKKNYASSSQSHKMGATAMFNDILHHLAASGKYPELLNEVEGNVAVRQHPVYAFQKIPIEGSRNQYRRKFIGLFTVGPDKGDKGFFGFKDPRIKDKAIRLEGTDHLKGVGFNYPWEVDGVETIKYNHDKEALCIVTGSDATKWTALFEQSYCGDKETAEDIAVYLKEKYKPAYECAYYNNPLIVGTSMSIEDINADKDSFKLQRRSTDNRLYSYCEFWIDGEYDIYYLNQERNQYEKNGINLLIDLGIDESSLEGKTIEEKNELFIQKRVERFKQEAPKYFNITDAIYQLMFLFMILASDNFEKNMYPYLMDLLWRFFQDDLDSIFSTDNQAQDTKKYSAELHDFTDDTNSAYVFKGEDSAFWQSIELAFPAECKKMGFDILQAMYEMASSGTTTMERLLTFFDDYFFNRAQNYFTPSAYNDDTEYSYEEAWNNKKYVSGIDIHPLAQALGSHESTERGFLEKRLVYLMSKFSYGGFANASDTDLGIISVRVQTKQPFTLTPAIDLYPTMLGGQGAIASSDNRVKAGEPITLYPEAENNTNVYIVGADYLSDIGDLKDLKVDPSSAVKLSVSSKRLRRLKVGDENSVTSYISTLDIGKCDSLETVDARNLTTLVDAVNLTSCPRLIKAYFGGTNIPSVKIAKGSKIEELQLPGSIASLDLRDIKFLSTISIPSLSNLTLLRLENSPSLQPFNVLKTAYNSGTALKNIRLIDFNHTVEDNKDITMLSNIADNKASDNSEHIYGGIDSEGNATTSKPIIEGVLNIDTINRKDYDKLLSAFSLTINYKNIVDYIMFADPEVLKVLLANGVGDGTGITEEQAAKVTNIGTWFERNTAIETFDEFEKFTGIKALNNNVGRGGEFQGCTNLKSIILPPNVTVLNFACFNGLFNLKNLVLPESITTIGERVFTGCGIENDIYLPNLTKVSSDSFLKSKIRRILSLGKITTIPSGSTGTGNGVFKDCVNLMEVHLPDTLVTIGALAFQGDTSLTTIEYDWSSLKTLGLNAFYNCTALEIEDLSLPNLTSLGQNAFYGVKIKKISDLGKLTALPAVGYTGGQTFGDWETLEEIVLPDTLQVVGDYALYKYNCKVNGLPHNITSIGYNAFYNALFLDSEINLPNLTGTLKTQTFANTNITKVLNLGSITGTGGNINSGPFAYCTDLVECILPETLTNIGYGLVWGCSSLTNMVIPASVVSIGDSAFGQCTSLTSLICKPAVPPTLGANVFNNTNCIIYVQDGSVEQEVDNGDGTTSTVTKTIVELYKEASGWSAYSDRIKSLRECTIPVSIADENVLAILTSNFDVNYNNEFDLGDLSSIKSLNYVFANNQDISNFDELEQFTSLNGFKSGTKPYWGDFHGCSLISTRLPKHITVLPKYLFTGSTNLKSVGDMRHITSIGYRVFQNTSLEGDLILPNLTSISAGAFNNTMISRVLDLGSINKLENWDSDARGVFSDCDRLTVAVLPSTLTSIGSAAFENSSLETLILKSENPPSLGENALNNTNITSGTIYVPDNSVSAYSSAFSQFVSIIKPINQLQTDNPDLYEEIKDYL